MNQDSAKRIVEEVVSLVPREDLTKLVKAATRAHTAADIQKIAAGYGHTLSDEQAEQLLFMYSEEVQLPPDFLDFVSGGTSREEASVC